MLSVTIKQFYIKKMGGWVIKYFFLTVCAHKILPHTDGLKYYFSYAQLVCYTFFTFMWKRSINIVIGILFKMCHSPEYVVRKRYINFYNFNF